MGFVTLDVLIQELLLFATIKFFGLFSADFWDIELNFCIEIGFDFIQVKFDFSHAWPFLQESIPFAKV